MLYICIILAASIGSIPPPSGSPVPPPPGTGPPPPPPLTPGSSAPKAGSSGTPDPQMTVATPPGGFAEPDPRTSHLKLPEGLSEQLTPLLTQLLEGTETAPAVKNITESVTKPQYSSASTISNAVVALIMLFQ